MSRDYNDDFPILDMEDLDKFKLNLEYHPLSLVNMTPEVPDTQDFELRSHIG
jgi:hypothetical protein